MIGLRAGARLTDTMDVRVRMRAFRDRLDGIESEKRPTIEERFITDLPQQTDRYTLHVIHVTKLPSGASLRLTMGRQQFDNFTAKDRRGSPIDERRDREHRMQSFEAIVTVPEGRRTWVAGTRFEAEHFQQSLTRTVSTRTAPGDDERTRGRAAHVRHRRFLRPALVEAHRDTHRDARRPHRAPLALRRVRRSTPRGGVAARFARHCARLGGAWLSRAERQGARLRLRSLLLRLPDQRQPQSLSGEVVGRERRPHRDADRGLDGARLRLLQLGGGPDRSRPRQRRLRRWRRDVLVYELRSSSDRGRSGSTRASSPRVGCPRNRATLTRGPGTTRTISRSRAGRRTRSPRRSVSSRAGSSRCTFAQGS